MELGFEEQEQLLGAINSGIWQREAEAWHRIVGERLFLRWRNPEHPRQHPFRSLAAICKWIGQSPALAYTRSELARDPRFELLKSCPLEIRLAKRLYELPLDSKLFEVLVLLLKIGCFPLEVERALDSKQPLLAALALKQRKSEEVQKIRDRLDELLPS